MGEQRIRNRLALPASERVLIRHWTLSSGDLAAVA
jgi:hypothetical protein